MGTPRRASRRGRARSALRRPAPRARGDEPAGVREPAHARARRCAAPTSPSPRWTTTCRRPTARSPTRSARGRCRPCRPTPTSSASRSIPGDPPGQGIVHVIGPEMGYTQPGMTIVCGDSHTSTHGAFGALAFGIGTSEVEHVLATQTLPQHAREDDGGDRRGRAARRRRRQGRHPRASSTASAPGGGVGHVLEYRGSAIRALSMEGRMTICNMSIEGGARAGMVAPDDTTFAYVEGRPHAPEGRRLGSARSTSGARLPSDAGATFDAEVELDATELQALRELGHEPGAVGHDRRGRPRPRRLRRAVEARRGRARARVHGPHARARPSARSGPTRSSSARARTRASRTCAWRPRSSAGARSPRTCARWSCPAASP